MRYPARGSTTIREHPERTAPRDPSERKHFERMTVWVLEVEATSTASMVDRHVVGRERSTTVGKTLVPDSLKDSVELTAAYLEGIVLPIEGRARVEVQH